MFYIPLTSSSSVKYNCVSIMAYCLRTHNLRLKCNRDTRTDVHNY